MFDTIRSRKNSKYDAVAGVSGGTDSSYSVYLAAKSGLRILAVHLDNGWDTATALHNIYQLSLLPNVDFISYVLDWNKFRNIQRAFLESGVPDIELPTDLAIFKVQFDAARRYGVQSIICGGNMSNEGILPASWMYNPRDSAFSSSVLESSSSSPSDFQFLKFGLRDEFYHRILLGIKYFYPLDVIPYDKISAATELGAAIDWRSHGQKHSESIYTRFCQSIYQPTRHGFEYRRAHLSADICMGRIDRERAIDLLTTSSLSELQKSQDICFVAAKIGYSVSQLKSLMSSPPLWYVDFDNRQDMLGLVYDAYRALTFKKKLSNF